MTDDFGQFTEEELRRYGELRLEQCLAKIQDAKRGALEYLVSFGAEGDLERSTPAQMRDNRELLSAVREAAVARAQAHLWEGALRIGDGFRADSYKYARYIAVRRMAEQHRLSSESYRIENEGAGVFYELSEPDMIRWWLDECDSQPDGKQKIDNEEES